MANRNFANSRIYTGHVMPVLIDCNFVVDSANSNGLGIRSLKGPYVKNVYMHTSATPAPGNPNPQGSTGGGTPPGGLDLATSANFAILAYAAITGSTGAGSVVTGDMGIYPNNLSSITNFPPSVDIGTIHAADSAANQAIIDATSAFTTGNALSATAIPAVLDGQTLVPGVYKEASSTFSLAGTINGTLTFNGPGAYIFQASSTLVTGAGGIPTFAFTGGATPTNTFIYWLLGSSGTINVGVTSAGSVFYGTVIAQASVTATQAGTIDGRLFALTGAITLSDTNAVNVPASGPSGGGVIVVQLEDNYSRSLTGFKAIVSPVSGTSIKIDNSALTLGVAYIITTLGDATVAKWNAIGVPLGITPAAGLSFIAASNGGAGNVLASRVMATASAGSGILSIETIGDPNLSIAPDPTTNPPQGFGSQFILQCHDYAGANAAPADGTVISLAFLLSNSSVLLAGE